MSLVKLEMQGLGSCKEFYHPNQNPLLHAFQDAKYISYTFTVLTKFWLRMRYDFCKQMNKKSGFLYRGHTSFNLYFRNSSTSKTMS